MRKKTETWTWCSEIIVSNRKTIWEVGFFIGNMYYAMESFIANSWCGVILRTQNLFDTVISTERTFKFVYTFNPFWFHFDVVSYVVVQMWLFYSELLGVTMVDAEVGSPSYLWGWGKAVKHPAALEMQCNKLFRGSKLELLALVFIFLDIWTSTEPINTWQNMLWFFQATLSLLLMCQWSKNFNFLCFPWLS